ncbi:hypothetical protein GC170_19135, partial [bacterium]|nr:hypothetical protein [bacterium]
SSPVNATIVNATAIGTILNDDARPSISIGQASLVEGNSGTTSMVFTVSLTNAASTPVTVNYSTSDGTAIAGSDYLATAGTLTIPAGATSATIAVPILGDTVVEGNETFTVNLSAPSVNATIGTAAATGTVIDDDQAAIEMSVADVDFIEGNSGWSQMDFVVSLSAPASKDVTVMFATSDGTASSRGNTGDFEATAGILTIPAGQTSGLISVRIKGDKTFELDEWFLLNLNKPSDGIVLSRDQAVCTILNDDNSTGPRGGNAGAGFNESNLDAVSDIIASPVPELDFVLGEWMSRSKKISRAN